MISARAAEAGDAIAEQLAENVERLLVAQIAEDGSFQVADSGTLHLNLVVDRADTGSGGLRIAVGWNAGAPTYALHAEILAGTRSLDRLVVDDPLIPISGEKTTEILDSIARDAAFRIWEFLRQRAPREQSTAGYSASPPTARGCQGTGRTL